MMACQHLCRSLLLILLSAQFASAAARDYGGQYTADRIANLRANVAKYDWAKKEQAAAIKLAKPWLARSDDELWAMVPGQDLPRTIDVTIDRNARGALRLGCLVCGEKIDQFGAYPYTPDFDQKPWKLTCPSCNSVFPTNDFGKFYASGIDEHGLFNPKKADRSLLFNVEHPDPKDPLHTYGVDDGFGYVDPKTGRAHKFVGYYVWKYWDNLLNGVTALSNAYLYTGDVKYAHKAAILLDRIADVYPQMDWKPYAERGWYHSDGGRAVGKIRGSIWETSVVRTLADAYDMILSGTRDDAALFTFLGEKSKQFKLPTPKGTRDQFVQNVDENILRCAFKAIVAQQIRGNEGMHQLAATFAAQALDTDPETTQWLDWVFAPDGGAVPSLIVGKLDRDGVSPEGAPGYALLWTSLLGDLADRMCQYPRYTKHDVFKEFPQFRAAFSAASRMLALGIATPNIGDTGTTGSLGKVGMNADLMAMAYRYTHAPEIAVAAYRANNNSAAGLGRDIFSADPDALSREIESVVQSAGPRKPGELMTGFGLALLESGSGTTGTALAMNFGRSDFHAHLDQLNFDLLAFGHWLTPHLGYPEYATTSPHRNYWVHNTISHNTVTIDGQGQKTNWGGRIKLHEQLDGFAVIEVEAPNAYPQISRYARTMMLIDAGNGNAYAIDLFRAAGGKDHLYSFHGPPGAVSVDGLKLIEQTKGTYAGEAVPSRSESGEANVGYSFLANVKRDRAPSANFTFDWTAEDGYRGLKSEQGVHLRLHGLSQSNDVALADGVPPQNKPGNPKSITYALLHRASTNGSLESTFVNVIEPYAKTPFIKSTARLEAPSDTVALRIELTDGSVDRVMYNATKFEADGVQFTGKVGFVRQSGDGKVLRAAMAEASNLKCGSVELNATPRITGKVVKMNKALAGPGKIWIDAKIAEGISLIGEPIMIANDNERDACYVIRSVSNDGDQTCLDCGEISFVRGFAGPTIEVRGQQMPKDYKQGYLYDFEEGAAFTIPTHAEFSKAPR